MRDTREQLLELLEKHKDNYDEALVTDWLEGIVSDFDGFAKKHNYDTIEMVKHSAYTGSELEELLGYIREELQENGVY